MCGKNEWGLRYQYGSMSDKIKVKVIGNGTLSGSQAQVMMQASQDGL